MLGGGYLCANRTKLGLKDRELADEVEILKSANRTKLGLKGGGNSRPRTSTCCANRTKLGLKVAISPFPTHTRAQRQSNQAGIERGDQVSEVLKSFHGANRTKLGLKVSCEVLICPLLHQSANRTKLGLKVLELELQLPVGKSANRTKLGLKAATQRHSGGRTCPRQSNQAGIESLKTLLTRIWASVRQSNQAGIESKLVAARQGLARWRQSNQAGIESD